MVIAITRAAGNKLIIFCFQILEHTLTSLTDIKPVGVSAVNQYSGSLVQLAKNPAILTSKAQVILLFLKLKPGSNEDDSA